MLLQKLREEVYKMNMELPKNDLVVMTSGNVSGKDPETDYVVIKPSGIKYEELSPEKMVIVDLDGNIVEGDLKPSVDTISHLVVYKGRKDIGGIVHTHSPYATSFAILGRPIPVYLTSHADYFGEEIPIARYASPMPLDDVGKALLEVINKEKRPEWVKKHSPFTPVVLLKNHGVFTFGKTPTEALKYAVMVEEIAKTCHLALIKGSPEGLPSSEIKKWYERFHEVYGQK
ncbi:MAG TPA: L-ribulose-5-phosphate 4-epimerase [Dictyoglomaceae bacterium]|mgnify:CR=1 FL=1|nr:L-ribulose-5-phosphate 4-epimerase [Dictyoglomaceae bacterium]HOL39316.1 L-ribulose-5-phosphate 4-epimerase [Dictyoglomaceae bacterium]HOP95031.1 L-ribulose-5-phosphate 4-epimerase [Dictyoglomaceae bacterium]HPP16002.1 L-ribulose-5-phosphate 4-epimerase [Dictyoglomaceae bacterium]HPU42977.1 L-ribulose-5-phosphate 4-epimerase [Dictyoglomaceae bacterium]